MVAVSMISASPGRDPLSLTRTEPVVAGSGVPGVHAPQVEILMPTKKPRSEELTREQQRTNQALHSRRLRIEHVNSSVKRCRIVKDRIRLWKEGVRDLVIELCCAHTTSGCASRPGNRWFNRDKLI